MTQRETIAFIIFLADYWGDDEFIMDMSDERVIMFFHKWRDQWLPALNQEHNGDCVNIPAACTRCHVEQIISKADTLAFLLGV